MKDTILWNEESDKYTERSKQRFSDIYEEYDLYAVNKCSGLLKTYHPSTKTVLDLGCAYGGFIHHLNKSFPECTYYGVDPGKETIAFAQSNLTKSNFNFIQGHAHELPFEDGKFDLIVLNMVLQWIPRKLLIKSIAEIERVLAIDGVIFIQEFLPFNPKYSQSSHNENIFIFKDDYEKILTTFPWLKNFYSEILHSDEGEDYQKSFSFIKKIKMEDAYILKKW